MKSSLSLFFLGVHWLTGCLGDVYVTDNVTFTIIYATYRSEDASFGQSLPYNGLRGAAVMASPLDACQEIEGPPVNTTFDVNPFWVAVISRYGGCTFEDKVRNAMEANFDAAIVFNVDSNKVIPMGGTDDDLIPSVFIGQESATELLTKYSYDANPSIRVILTADDPFNIDTYILPFAIVVGICFVIMLGIIVYKCIQDHRRRRRHRLPKSALKKLPIHKFKTGDPFDTCCICLDDFADGDKLRILPCDHGYHSKCIDPWLLKNKRICPQCRKRVFARREAGDSGDSNSDEPTETAPLVRSTSSTGATQGGTFSGASTSDNDTMARLQVRPFTGRSSSRSSTAENQPSRPFGGRSSPRSQDRRQRPRGFRRQVLSQRRRRYETLVESSSSEDEGFDPGEGISGTSSGYVDNQRSLASSGQLQTSAQLDEPKHVSAEVHVVNVEDEVEEDGAIGHESPKIAPEEDDEHSEPEVVIASSSPRQDMPEKSDNEVV